MGNGNSKDALLIRIILVVLSLNLILTAIMFGSFMIDRLAGSPTADGKTTGSEPLPGDLATVEQREQLFEEFKLNYNSGDKEQLLSMFGKAYQIRMRAMDFDKQMTSIRDITPTINDGAYYYYESQRLGAGVTQFTLHYQIDTPKGPMELKLTLTQQGNTPSSLIAYSEPFRPLIPIDRDIRFRLIATPPEQ